MAIRLGPDVTSQGSDVMSGSSDQLGAEKSVDDGINVIRWYKMDEDFWMRSSAS